MGVRIWGVVEDRLIELRGERSTANDRIRLVGLPADRARTAADRVRAALLNSRVLPEAPSVEIRLQPAVNSGPTSDLDLAIALAVLARMQVVGAGLRWVLANGRLGPDGTIHAAGLFEPCTLAEVVRSLCHTPLLGFEQVFEGETR